MPTKFQSPAQLQEYLIGAFSRPTGLLELGVLIVCVVLAALFARRINRSNQTATNAPFTAATHLGRAGVRRLAFPLAGLLLMVIAGRTLQAFGIREGFIALGIALLLAMAAIRTVVYILRITFAPSGWLAHSERFVAATVWVFLFLHLSNLLPEAIEALGSVSFTVADSPINLWQILKGAALVLVTVLIALWAGGLIEDRLMRAERLDLNVRMALSRLAKSLLALLAVLLALPAVGINLTTLSVFGGALGVGVGFGMQKIASNYVSGFILLLDRSIRVGNMITVGQDRGQVTHITTRYTVLRGLTGIEAIVPNEMLVSSVVLNESYTDPKVRLAIPVQVGYRTNLDEAMAVMTEAARAQTRVLTDPPPQAFLTAFADSGINLELGIWIADPQQGTLPVRSAINLAIWREFQRRGIEIPYPQREVRLLGAPAPASSTA